MRAYSKTMLAMFVFALVSAALLSACGGGGAAKTGDEKGPVTAAGDGSLERIKKAGVLRWGADASGGAPFAYKDPNNPDKIIGFEVEIMDKVAEHMGVKPEMVQGDKDKYKTLDDLKGKKIGTLENAESNNVLVKAGFNKDDILIHPDSLTPYSDLEIKRTDAVLQEAMIADFYAGKNAKLYNVPATFSPGKYAVALKPEDQTLLKEVDRVLNLMKQNGELAAIYKKWNLWNEKQKGVGMQEKK
ncbi:MAG: transporter substrate-binding domain-containing protein [Planctomycetes bacterium]|nr:transporter substrate-binding domain-containing protein [Planctomycetota bacterium]